MALLSQKQGSADESTGFALQGAAVAAAKLACLLGKALGYRQTMLCLLGRLGAPDRSGSSRRSRLHR